MSFFARGAWIGCVCVILAVKAGLAVAAVQTSLTYDYLGRVIQVTEQGQTEDYFYSGEKRVFKKEASGKKRLYLFEDHSVVFDREVEFGKRGDADGTGTWTITDAVYLINYIFADGPSPKPNLLAGDADSNSIITIGDAVWLINFIFTGGPAPSSATLSLSGAANVFAPGAGRLWSDGAMGNEDLYFVEDSVSSTSAVLAGNALGEVIRSTPFGEQLTTSNLEKRYLFTGKEMDATTGLFYYGARYYDPALGRFLQWDSVMDGPNRYLYVRNNPINANDPSGHDWSLFNSAESSTTSNSIVPAPAFQNATIGAPSYSSIMNQRIERQAQLSLEPTGILSPVDRWAMENFDGPESASRGDALLMLSNFAFPVMSEIRTTFGLAGTVGGETTRLPIVSNMNHEVRIITETGRSTLSFEFEGAPRWAKFGWFFKNGSGRHGGSFISRVAAERVLGGEGYVSHSVMLMDDELARLYSRVRGGTQQFTCTRGCANALDYATNGRIHIPKAIFSPAGIRAYLDSPLAPWAARTTGHSLSTAAEMHHLVLTGVSYEAVIYGYVPLFSVSSKLRE